MKKIILYISFLLSLSAQSQIVNFMQVVASGGGGGGIPQTVASTVIDDGYYNGFPFPAIMSNGDIVCLYKKAGGHAPKGPMTLARTTNGGSSWSEAQISVNGVPIESPVLSLVVLSNDRIIIAYQEDETYTYLKFAYRDGYGHEFTFADSINLGTGYSSSPSPIKMLVMPSGKIRCGIYRYGLTTNPAILAFINSTDNGESWTYGEEIFSAQDTGFGDYKGTEFSFIITDNTGVDSTCKLATYIRPATIGIFLQYKSIDGGANWNTDTTTTYNPGVYNGGLNYQTLGANPVDIIIHNDSVYMVSGTRIASGGGFGFTLQVRVTTKENAFTNNHNIWKDVPVDTLLHFNAETLGSDIDCGYPLLFHDGNGELWCMYYDISTEAKDPMITEDRCWIKLIKIAD